MSIPSLLKINYLLRPNKQIERKIFIEIIRSLEHKFNINIENSTYIGMGSIYYYDFLLFHKYLKIRNLISIDDKTQFKERFKFNLPYDYIDFFNLKTTEFLSTKFKKMSSDSKIDESIYLIWFDYDSKLITKIENIKRKEFIIDPSKVDDIRIIINKCSENDIFILTVDVDYRDSFFLTTELRQTFIETFEKYLSKKYRNINNIIIENLANIIQDVIINIIRSEEKYNKFKFKKLFSFEYKDTKKMYTLGGIFHSKNIKRKMRDINYTNLNEDEIIKIYVPNLTYKEKITLDSMVKNLSELINLDNNDEIYERLGFEIDRDELKNYLEYYKYYPQYYEGII